MSIRHPHVLVVGTAVEGHLPASPDPSFSIACPSANALRKHIFRDIKKRILPIDNETFIYAVLRTVELYAEAYLSLGILLQTNYGYMSKNHVYIYSPSMTLCISSSTFHTNMRQCDKKMSGPSTNSVRLCSPTCSPPARAQHPPQ